MPRFGIKTLLLVFGMFAFWLASLWMGDIGGDVQRSIILAILFGSAAAAIYGRGRQRAFWGSFFAVIFLMGCDSLRTFLPMYFPYLGWPNTVADKWGTSFTSDPSLQSSAHSWIYWTLRMSWILALATLIGFLVAAVHDKSRKSPAS
jgi:hypothetical protein